MFEQHGHAVLPYGLSVHMRRLLCPSGKRNAANDDSMEELQPRLKKGGGASTSKRAEQEEEDENEEEEEEESHHLDDPVAMEMEADDESKMLAHMHLTSESSTDLARCAHCDIYLI